MTLCCAGHCCVVFCSARLHRTMLPCAMQCHAVQCCGTLHMPNRAKLSCARLCCLRLGCPVMCCAVKCHAMLCCVEPGCAVLCLAALYHAVPCHAVPCRAIPYHTALYPPLCSSVAPFPDTFSCLGPARHAGCSCALGMRQPFMPRSSGSSSSGAQRLGAKTATEVGTPSPPHAGLWLPLSLPCLGCRETWDPTFPFVLPSGRRGFGEVTTATARLDEEWEVIRAHIHGLGPGTGALGAPVQCLLHVWPGPPTMLEPGQGGSLPQFPLRQQGIAASPQCC